MTALRTEQGGDPACIDRGFDLLRSPGDAEDLGITLDETIAPIDLLEQSLDGRGADEIGVDEDRPELRANATFDQALDIGVALGRCEKALDRMGTVRPAFPRPVVVTVNYRR